MRETKAKYLPRLMVMKVRKCRWIIVAALSRVFVIRDTKAKNRARFNVNFLRN